MPHHLRSSVPPPTSSPAAHLHSVDEPHGLLNHTPPRARYRRMKEITRSANRLGTSLAGGMTGLIGKPPDAAGSTAACRSSRRPGRQTAWRRNRPGCRSPRADPPRGWRRGNSTRRRPGRLLVPGCLPCSGTHPPDRRRLPLRQELHEPPLQGATDIIAELDRVLVPPPARGGPDRKIALGDHLTTFQPFQDAQLRVVPEAMPLPVVEQGGLAVGCDQEQPLAPRGDFQGEIGQAGVGECGRRLIRHAGSW